MHGPGDDRRARLSADENDLVDIAGLELCIPHRLLARLNRCFDEVHDEFFELRTAKGRIDMFRPTGIGRDEGQADIRFADAREFALGSFGRFFQALQRQAIGRKVDAAFALECLDKPVDYSLVEIFAAEKRVAGRGKNFEHAVIDLEDRYVECAAAEVIYRDLFGLRFSKAVR